MGSRKIKGTHRQIQWFFICTCKAFLPLYQTHSGLLPALLLLATRKQATRVGETQLRFQIFIQLFLYIITNLSCILAFHNIHDTKIYSCDI